MGYCSSGWPPTMLPKTDSWLSGWRAMRQLAKEPNAHKIEQYRKLVGEEASGPFFAAKIYYDALKELLVRSEAALGNCCLRRFQGGQHAYCESPEALFMFRVH